jgi:hypothetical protein
VTTLICISLVSKAEEVGLSMRGRPLARGYAQAGSNQLTVSVPGGGFSLGPNFNLVISGSGASVGPGTPTPSTESWP